MSRELLEKILGVMEKNGVKRYSFKWDGEQHVELTYKNSPNSIEYSLSITQFLSQDVVHEGERSESTPERSESTPLPYLGDVVLVDFVVGYSGESEINLNFYNGSETGVILECSTPLELEGLGINGFVTRRENMAYYDVSSWESALKAMCEHYVSHLKQEQQE